MKVAQPSVAFPKQNSFNNYVKISLPIASLFIIAIFLLYCLHWKKKKKKKKEKEKKEKEKKEKEKENKEKENNTDKYIRLRDTKTLSGLKNSNSMAYANSMIQAIASSEQLILEYSEILRDQDPVKYPKMGLFIQLLKNINCPKENKTCIKVNTDLLMKVIKDTGFDGSEPRDAFEFMTELIAVIEKEVKDVLEQRKMTIPPKFRLLYSFTEFPNFNKVHDHLALAVPLCGAFRERPGVEINSLLDALIDDGPHEMQISLFEEAPSVLLLHIQANEWSVERGELIKPSYFIQYGEIMKYEFNIQMKKEGSKRVRSRVEYELRAVVNHDGGMEYGHYVTHRKNQGEWYLTNDEQVTREHFDPSIVPYIMVYERMQSETNV